MPDDPKTTERWDNEARVICAKLIPHTTSVHNARVIADALAAERARCIGIVTALWGADLVTTQAAMKGEITLDEAVKR